MDALLSMEPRVAGEEILEFSGEFPDNPGKLHNRCPTGHPATDYTLYCIESTTVC